MGYRHERSDLVAAAVETAREDGIGQLTYSRVAKRLGISDRMVVYYFPTKEALISEVLLALGGELQALLEQAFGAQRLPAADLARRAWPLLTTPAADRIFAIFFELTGLASAGTEPYRSIAALMIDGWTDWMAPYVEGSTPAVRRRRALALEAQLDGLLLMRRIAGAEAADAAATELGIRVSRG